MRGLVQVCVLRALARGAPYVLLLGWLGGVLLLSSQKRLPSLPSAVPSALPIDVLGHLGVYGVLGVLVTWCLWRVGRSWSRSPASVFLAGLFGFLWGAFDEWYQGFVPGRDSSLVDVGVDGAGAFTGGWLFLALKLVVGVVHLRSSAPPSRLKRR